MQSNWATDWSGTKEYLRIWNHVRVQLIKDEDSKFYEIAFGDNYMIIVSGRDNIREK